MATPYKFCKAVRYVSFTAITILFLSLTLFQSVSAQIPNTFTNLQVLPEDISKDSLMSVMRSFSFALGVRCQHCHVGGDGRSFKDVEFDKDDDLDKRRARFILRVVNNMNQHVLPLVPERNSPPVVLQCDTCHRGLTRPILLKDDMLMTTHASGVDSAITRFRSLKEDYATDGTYDFGQWEMTQVAETLSREGNFRDAISIYQLNEEFFPESRSIITSIAQLAERAGKTDLAIKYYERALELIPGNRRIMDKLSSLQGKD